MNDEALAEVLEEIHALQESYKTAMMENKMGQEVAWYRGAYNALGNLEGNLRSRAENIQRAALAKEADAATRKNIDVLRSNVAWMPGMPVLPPDAS